VKARRQSFRPGIDTLAVGHRSWLKGRRIGLVSHPAALASNGESSVDRLARCPGIKVVALFGPEHGFFGDAVAGRHVRTTRHPHSGVPVYSLYGKQRRPTRRMLTDVDTIVFDLQDLGARMYTFVSTLRYVLEAAAELGKQVIVADRPIPLPNVVDGPMLHPAFASFVALVTVPMVYGMTPGETALFLRVQLGLELDLKVAVMQGYERNARRGSDWPPWVPPSQGIRSWESAMCYTSTVAGEALPALDCGRGTGLPFQVFGATWLNGREVAEALSEAGLRGVRFLPHPYVAQSGRYAGRLLDGVRMVVHAPDRFRPIRASVTILSVVADLYGPNRLWRARGTRPDFFDALFGTDATRRQLLAATPPADIARGWRRENAGFIRSRREHLLY